MRKRDDPNKHSNHIDELRELSYEEESSPLHGEAETENMEGDSRSKREFKKGKMPTKGTISPALTIILQVLGIALPPPLNFVALAILKPKLRGFYGIAVMTISGFFMLLPLSLFLLVPVGTHLNTQKNLKYTTYYPSDWVDKYGEPSFDFDFDASSQSYAPDYAGDLSIDYNKLQTLYPNDNRAKASAQRYQLYSEISQITGVPVIWLYNIETQESSGNAVGGVEGDIYKNYTRETRGGMRIERTSGFNHANGPFQTSSLGKHIPVAFESKYSTRTYNAESTVYGLKRLSGGATSSYADGFAYSDRLKFNAYAPTHLQMDNLIEITDEASLQNLKSQIERLSIGIAIPPNSKDFGARVLKAEHTDKYVQIRRTPASGAEYFVDPQQRRSLIQTPVYKEYDEVKAPGLMRFNAFYYPDMAASIAYDMVWFQGVVDALMDGSYAPSDPVFTSSALNSKMINSTVTYKEYYSKLSRAQKDELGNVLFGAHYNGVPEEAWRDDMMKSVLEIIKTHGTLLNSEATYKYSPNKKTPIRTYQYWRRDADGILHSVDSTTQSWYAIPGSMGFKTSKSRGYHYAFSFPLRGHAVYEADKALFEKVKMTVTNASPGANGLAYSHIEDIRWSDADKLFSKVGEGGPTTMNLIDVETGREFTVSRISGDNHAIVNPQSLSDLRLMENIWGDDYGKHVNRAVLIKGRGVLYPASLSGYPQTKTDDIEGGFEMFFTGSLTAMGTVNNAHTSKVAEAIQAKKYLVARTVGMGLDTTPTHSEDGYAPVVRHDYLKVERGYYLNYLDKEKKRVDANNSHRGIDFSIQRQPYYTKKSFQPKTDNQLFTQDVLPTVKIYALREGIVDQVRCVKKSETGKSPSWDTKGKASDHSIKTYNPFTNDLGNLEGAESTGECVVIRDSVDGSLWIYMHLWCGSVQVIEGQHVRAGDVIGYMGNTGRSTGGHLHLQNGWGGASKNINYIQEIVFALDGKKVQR